VTALVNTSGTVLERFIYDPYGTATVLNATTWASRSDGYSWVYRFQGGRYDPSSGKINFRYRDLDTVTGTWMEQDAWRVMTGPNAYEFLDSGPVTRVDPLGLIPCGARTVEWPAKGPAVVVSTTDALNPDELDKKIKEGKLTLKVLETIGGILEGAKGEAPVAGGAAGGVGGILKQFGSPEEVEDIFKAIGAMVAESRFIWIKQHITTYHCECHQLVTIEFDRWFTLDFGDARGDLATDASKDEIAAAMQRLRERLQGKHPSPWEPG